MKRWLWATGLIALFVFKLLASYVAVQQTRHSVESLNVDNRTPALHR